MVHRQTRTMITLTVVLLSLLFPLSGCEAAKPQHPTIEGADLVRAGEETNRKLVEDNIRRLKDKYQRHFAEGRYFADLSEAKKKLNEEYNLYLKAQMDKVFPEPYILRMEAEFVNSEVQAYAKGEKTLSEILQSPGENMMSLKGQFFGFRKNPKNDAYTDEETPEHTFLEQLSQEYVAAGVDFIEIWFNEYPQAIFKKYPFEEMQRQENLFLYLKDEDKKLMSGYCMKTYYDGGYVYKFGEPPIIRFSSGMTDKPYPGRANAWEEIQNPPFVKDEDYTLEYRRRDNLYYLKKKYRMEFFHLGEEYYAPVKYPEMFFKSIHDYLVFHRDRNPEGWDYFAGLYYQYLLNRYLDELLKKEGLQEDVLYFVQTQPHFDPNPFYPVNTNQEEYPFGEEGFDEAYFLGDGYTGTVYANFILLEEPGKTIPPEKLQKVIEETRRLMGVPGRNERRKIHPIPGLRITEIHTYRLSAYDKAVVKDLFRRHPLTEREDNPAPNFYTAFSDIYSVRTETEGFLYLDIFAEKTGEESVVLEEPSDKKEK